MLYINLMNAIYNILMMYIIPKIRNYHSIHD